MTTTETNKTTSHHHNDEDFSSDFENYRANVIISQITIQCKQDTSISKLSD
jgi:hypothetical protein